VRTINTLRLQEIHMDQPIASESLQHAFVKAAMDEYKRQGIPQEQGQKLLADQLAKLGQALHVKQALPGDTDESLSEVKPSVWETLTDGVKRTIMGALAGGALGGATAGGANALLGYGLSNLNRNSLEDALASTTDPGVQQMLQQSLAQHSPVMDTVGAGVRGAVPGALGGAAVGGVAGLADKMGQYSGGGSTGAYSGKPSYSAGALKPPKPVTSPKPVTPTTSLKPVTPATPTVPKTPTTNNSGGSYEAKRAAFYDRTAQLLAKITERTDHETQEQS
jgi:hypothetical protein